MMESENLSGYIFNILTCQQIVSKWHKEGSLYLYFNDYAKLPTDLNDRHASVEMGSCLFHSQLTSFLLVILETAG